MKFGIELPPTSLAFGGELPLGCDALLAQPRPVTGNCLTFSHGRAALTWLCRRLGPFDRAVLSAYTCPVVPELLCELGLTADFVDATGNGWDEVALAASGRVLVVVPAFLGHDPEVDVEALAANLGGRGIVLVDAAQTAFGHETIPASFNVAVLSCPRKCVALGDGAILSWKGVTDFDLQMVRQLPWAVDAVGAKIAVRALSVGRSPTIEPDILALNSVAESQLPDEPHRMSDSAVWGLSWIDRAAHKQRRWDNWNALAYELKDTVEIVRRPGGTPFNLSILVEDRDTVIAGLKSARVFATALWPNAVHTAQRHPIAAKFASHLVCLPIDQRYGDLEMQELAARVLRVI